MKRRSNKSHRVPNVKLRPGEPQSSSSIPVIESVWPEDSQFRSDDTTFKDTCPRPFKSVVLCATGIADKAEVFKKALELGASTTSAFTDKVTHLIAVAHGGPKYKCALEHGIPIVQPSWVTDNYDIWLHGDDVEADLEKSIDPHRLPVFSHLVVCTSGIPSLERRSDIRRIVERQGGSYVKAIERPVRVTHLLCSGDEESDTMRYAEKFTQRGEAQIHMVWEDWFWDSLKVKGRLDEARYNVKNPKPPPVVLRNTQPDVPDSTVPSRANSLNAPPPPPADDLDEEAACVKVMPDITLKLWTGLLERRGYEVSNGEVVRSPSKSQNKARSSTPPLARRRAKHSGVISAVRTENTFMAPVEREPGSSRPIPFKRTTSTLTSSSRQSESGAGPSNQNSSKSASPQPKIFSSMRFSLLDEADTPAVVAAIEQHGGNVVYGKGEEGADIYVVRLSSAIRRYSQEKNADVRSRYRTECWLEQCIHEERVLAVDEHVSFKPLDIDLPIPDASSVRLSFSGLDQPEQLFTRRLLKTLGIPHAPQFSKKTTHLLCPSGLGLKFSKAREWGIPVVTDAWLASVAATGCIPGAGVYTVGGVGGVGGAEDVKGKGVEGKDAKGKGRALDVGQMDVDGRMHDITNNDADPDLQLHPQPPKPLTKSGPSLDRQHTTVLPPAHESGGFGFGQPTEMLLGSHNAASHPSSSASAASSMNAHHPSSIRPLTQGSPLVKYGTTTRSQMSFSSEGAGDIPPLSPGYNNPGANAKGNSNANPNAKRPLRLGRGATSRNPTSNPSLSTPLRDGAPTAPSSQATATTHTTLDDRDMMMRVPSSESPSPLKLHPNHLHQKQQQHPLQQRNSSVSPAKLDPGAAKALHESIASLLGKRSLAEDDDELPGVESAREEGEGESGGGARGKGKGKEEGEARKRTKRPVRAKASTRTRARAQARKPPITSSPPPAADPAAVVSLSAFDPYGGAPDEEHPSQTHSQRFKDDASAAHVVYEDPAQVQERQRLMSLLKANGSKSSVGSGVESIETFGSNASGGGGGRSASGRVTRRKGRVAGGF